MQKFYQMEAEDVKDIYHTGSGGLTASQVTQIRQEKGENILAERKKKSFYCISRYFIYRKRWKVYEMRNCMGSLYD